MIKLISENNITQRNTNHWDQQANFIMKEVKSTTVMYKGLWYKAKNFKNIRRH